MAKCCQNCGAALEDGVQICAYCGGAVAPQAPQPAQPQRPAQPQQQYYAQPQAPQSAPAKKKKGKVGVIVAAILCLAAIGAVCFFGFRDGGFFRGTNGEKVENDAAIVYDVKTIESLLDYAKKLEEAGNKDAAAAVYEMIANGGGADYIDEAHRDFPLISAADEVDEYKELFEKKGGDEK